MPERTDERFMQSAIDVCRRGVETGQAPFGAAIVQDLKVIASTHNRVWLDSDITAHAEVCCIREACRQLGTVNLAGCTIYSTTEPCPMCFSAIHWARIDRIVYGATIADAQQAGFRELPITNEMMKKAGSAPVQITSGCLRDKCAALFDEWRHGPEHRVY